MGEILAAVGAFEQAKSAYDRASGPMPEAAPLHDASSIMAGGPSAPDMSSGGFATAQPEQTQAPVVQAPMMPAEQAPTVTPEPTAPQPVDNPYAADTAKEIANGLGTSDAPQDVTVKGDSWQPKHESVLGVIGDFLMMRRGMQPIFRQRTDEANLKSAMQGFQRDPETAISRVRKVDPEMAYKMQQQLQVTNTNKALEDTRIADLREKGLTRIGGMLGAIQQSKNPEAVYKQTLPTMRRWIDSYHLDPSILSDNYDSEAVNAIRMGSIDPYRQESLANSNASREDLNNYRQESLQSLNQHRENTEAETQRHNLRLEEKSEKGKPTTRNVFGDNNRFVGTVSADGRKAALQGIDGQWYAFRLRTPGDISSRVRSPGEDEMLRKQMGGKK